jgi:isopentenyl diphosphate isomerase/L-lactate dehydrogenase-like FMN-dependent dehydrogenase
MYFGANCFGNTVLQAEMETCMRLLGAKNIDELGPRFVSHSMFLPI